MKETKTSAYYADVLEEHGFTVERGVAGMPTAFVATFGEGAPVIGVMAELDALPGSITRYSAIPQTPCPKVAQDMDVVTAAMQLQLSAVH